MATINEYESKVSPGVYEGFIEEIIETADIIAADDSGGDGDGDGDATYDLAEPEFPYAIQQVMVKVDEYLAAPALTAATLVYGDAGDPDALLESLNVFGTTSLAAWQLGTQGVETDYGSTGPSIYEATNSWFLTFACVDDLPTELTAGRVRVRTYYRRWAKDEY